MHWNMEIFFMFCKVSTVLITSTIGSVMEFQWPIAEFRFSGIIFFLENIMKTTPVLGDDAVAKRLRSIKKMATNSRSQVFYNVRLTK